MFPAAVAADHDALWAHLLQGLHRQEPGECAILLVPRTNQPSQDHKRECPLCKASLVGHYNSKMPVNEFVERSIRRLLPAEHADRQKISEEEMSEIAGRPQLDGRVTIPGNSCLHIPPHLLITFILSPLT